MTKYEIQFKKIVTYVDGFTLNIVDVPITQIFQEVIERDYIIVTIDPDWKETNFGTIKDNQDSAWLFPSTKKDIIIDNLRARYLLE